MRLLILLVSSIAVAACNVNGKATISGRVMHHSDTIPDAVVYIKFDSGFPGSDVGLYDKSVHCDAEGNFLLTEIPKGTHYLYGAGWDAGISDSVFGGIPVLIDKKKLNKEVDLPVTE
jgi:hypothetical protein